jgi:basic membrane protein A
MKKFLALALVMLMFVSAVGCTTADEPAEVEEEPTEAQEPETPEVSEETPLKVAVLLPGPINDMGWNASAYEGLLAVESEFGAEISYQENVSQSDMEEVFRNFALAGYDVIFGHGFQFGDTAAIVADAFPDTKFVITSSSTSNGSNLGSVNSGVDQQGFLAGVMAAKLSETGKVGAIGGINIPPITGPIYGFYAGANYINPDIEVTAILTGSFDDVTKAKETARAMIDTGVDVIFANANQAGLGSIEACEDAGIYAIGSNQDQNPLAPDTVVQSVIKSTTRLFTYVVDKVVKGEFEGTFYKLGIDEGAIFLADWHGYDESMPELKAEMDEIIAGMKDGSVTYDLEQYQDVLN